MGKLFRVESKRKYILSKKESENIFKISPSFKKIVKSIYFDNYDLPCPVKVDIKKEDDKLISIVLRQNRHGDVKKEVRMFQALKEFGLPVPDVLRKPFKNEKGEWVAIYSLLPGENLQKLSMKSPKDLELAKNLLIEGVLKLKEASKFISKHEVSSILPRKTLILELEEVKKSKNKWIKQELFQLAIKDLEKVLKDIKTPLILSNGDYQPGNFLYEGNVITGFLDFESPSFQDPLMGFVKYPIYDLYPLGRTNLVERLLEKSGFSKKDFDIRLALGCLKILIKEIQIKERNKEMVRYRKRVLKLLNSSLHNIKGYYNNL